MTKWYPYIALAGLFISLYSLQLQRRQVEATEKEQSFPDDWNRHPDLPFI